MRGILLFAALMLVAAAVVPQLAEKATSGVGENPQSSAQQSRPVKSPAPNNGYRSLTLYRSGSGHFETDAVVNGRHLQFLVDTGASVVVLRESDAARLGIRPAQRDYRSRVSTANGVIMAAPTTLNRLEVGSLEVRNVAALVLPDQALSHNLLGMSFLSRVSFEHKNGRLVLTQ